MTLIYYLAWERGKSKFVSQLSGIAGDGDGFRV